MGLMTFLVLFMAAFGLAWPLAVLIAESALRRFGFEVETEQSGGSQRHRKNLAAPLVCLRGRPGWRPHSYLCWRFHLWRGQAAHSLRALLLTSSPGLP
jgi:hypothetical protein